MRTGRVSVDGPPGLDVYMDGNYVEPSGRTGEIFYPDIGRTTVFEVLDERGRITMRGEITVTLADAGILKTITLEPVAEPTGGEGQ